jgi:hypothetical protein
VATRICFIIPWYRAGDYDAAAALFGDMPRSYAAWLEHTRRWEEECRRSDAPFLRVLVRPREFHAWCRTARLQPDTEGRSAYIIERARSLLWPDMPVGRDLM